MTNFGILMEIKGIENPFDWSREAVKKLQVDGKGTYYSPSHRVPSKTSEGDYVRTHVVDSIEPLYKALGEYAFYIEDFIEDMQEVFPTLGDDWGIYMPEVKYLSPEPLVDYNDLSLEKYPYIHFVGDALSARGITVSGAQGIYVAESIIEEQEKEYEDFLSFHQLYQLKDFIKDHIKDKSNSTEVSAYLVRKEMKYIDEILKKFKVQHNIK